MEYLILDNTKRSTFEACPRMYYYKHIRNLRLKYGSSAIRYGVAFHKGAEILYNHIKATGFTNETLNAAVPVALSAAKEAFRKESEGLIFSDDYRNEENLIYCFTQYVRNFCADAHILKVLETEQKFKIHIGPKDSGSRYCYPFYFAGMIDSIISLNGQIWIGDYKTSGQPTYLQKKRMQRSPQFIGYDWAARKLGYNPYGCLITFHHIKCSKKKDGNWGKLAWSFDREPHMFMPEDRKEWYESLKWTAFKIHEALETGNWPMKFDSCFNYGGCSFTDLCKQNRFGKENLDLYINNPEDWDSKLKEGKEIDYNEQEDENGIY